MIWYLGAILIMSVLIYSPSTFHVYTAPKMYVFAVGVFGGFLFFASAWRGALPWLLIGWIGYWSCLQLVFCCDYSTLFEIALCVGWAFLVGAYLAPVQLLYMLSIAGALVALIALAEFAGYGIGRGYWQDFGTLHFGKIQGRRPAACLGNPDVLGSFSAAMLPLAVALMFPFNALLALIGLVLSQARASWLAAGLPGVPLFSSYFWIRKDEILQDHSLRERLKYYALTWKLIQERPWFGHGLGSFKFWAAREWSSFPRLNHVHCEWLEVLHDGGILGVALWSAIIVQSLRTLWTAGRIEQACALALGVLLIDGLFSLSLRVLPVQMLFWSFIGLAMRSDLSPITISVGIRCGLGLLLLAIPNAAILLMMADYHHKQALKAIFAKQDIEAGLEKLLLVLRLNPWMTEARSSMILLLEKMGHTDLADAQRQKLLMYEPYFYAR